MNIESLSEAEFKGIEFHNLREQNLRPARRFRALLGELNLPVSIRAIARQLGIPFEALTKRLYRNDFAKAAAVALERARNASELGFPSEEVGALKVEADAAVAAVKAILPRLLKPARNYKPQYTGPKKIQLRVPGHRRSRRTSASPQRTSEKG